MVIINGACGDCKNEMVCCRKINYTARILESITKYQDDQCFTCELTCQRYESKYIGTIRNMPTSGHSQPKMNPPQFQKGDNYEHSNLLGEHF